LITYDIVPEGLPSGDPLWNPTSKSNVPSFAGIFIHLRHAQEQALAMPQENKKKSAFGGLI
jgi:hypothetical protein